MARTITLELSEDEAGYVLDALSSLANHMPDPEFAEEPLDPEDQRAHGIVSGLRNRLQDAYHA